MDNRELSKILIESLISKELKGVYDIVKSDKELVLMIRSNYLNIYYNGGNILRIKCNSNSFKYEFDEYYFFPQLKSELGWVYDNKTQLEKSKDKRFFFLIDQDKAENDRKLLEKRKENLIELLPNDPQSFFRIAKEVMRNWNNANLGKTGERQEQHNQIINNSVNDNFCIIDIEYAVSRKYSYRCKTKKTENGEIKVPRFDIIAIDKHGVVCVIELKKGVKSLTGNSGLSSHLDCYNDSIGYDVNSKKEFIEHIKIINNQMKELGFQHRDIQDSENIRFLFAYAFKTTNRKKEIIALCNKAMTEKVLGSKCILIHNTEHNEYKLKENDIIVF